MFSRNLRFEIIQQRTLVTLKSCIRLVIKAEDDLIAEQEQFEFEMNGIPESLEAFDDTEHSGEIIDYYWDLYESFPNIRRKTEVINAYSVLEFGLKSLCSAYEKALKDKYIADKWYISNSKDYLRKEVKVGIDISKSKYWKEINLIQELRNKLTHDNGTINIKNTNLVDYINQSKWLSLDRSNSIIIQQGYAEHCYKVIYDFFFDLFIECPKYNKAYRHHKVAS